MSPIAAYSGVAYRVLDVAKTIWTGTPRRVPNLQQIHFPLLPNEQYYEFGGAMSTEVGSRQWASLR